jgi:transposase
LGYLLDKGLSTFVINPLHTSLFRKSLSLRKTKTDKVDSHTIATMLMSDVNLKSYSDTSYHNEELKSLTRYRFDKVKQRAKMKTSVSRLVTILLPELEKLVPSLHMPSVYALLSEFPSASAIAASHLTRLTNLLSDSSKGHYGKDTALLFREAARSSIGSHMPAKSLELKHTIKLIQELTTEIKEIEHEIKTIMDDIHSPILSIPGISYRMGAMIIAEIGNFSRFDSPDKILAYAGMSPATYQSGQLESSYSHMEKRGSRYLRYALYNATKYVCHWDPVFAAYLEKKRTEGKHYNVAISHADKKLVRVIYQLEKSRQLSSKLLSFL